MAFLMDDAAFGGQVMVGAGQPIVLGVGPTKIRGSGFVEGPLQIGAAQDFPIPIPAATVMIGNLKNKDSPPPLIPGALCLPVNNPFSLCVVDNAAIMGSLDVNFNIQAGGDLTVTGNVKSQCGGHILSAKKNFDIPHPTKDGWRLTHTCVEGPEASIYIRGRVRNKTEIEFPLYWEKLVDINTITVNLTPIGAHQDIIIKRWDSKKVYLQSKGGMPIDCFYYIMAERKDTEKLIPEYPGSIEDYPGDNSQRSIAGYHYDIKGE